MRDGTFEPIVKWRPVPWARQRSKRLFSKCANGKCTAVFDYRKGRLLRFPYRLKNAEAGSGHAVVHFWLCAECTKIYTLEYRERSGVAVLRSKISPVKKRRQNRANLQPVAAAGSRRESPMASEGVCP